MLDGRSRYVPPSANDLQDGKRELALVMRHAKMNTPHYRPEDKFTEASNALRLKQLYEARDYNGLLELALLINHQASFNSSRMKYFMYELLDRAAPGQKDKKAIADSDDDNGNLNELAA